MCWDVSDACALAVTDLLSEGAWVALFASTSGNVVAPEVISFRWASDVGGYVASEGIMTIEEG